MQHEPDRARVWPSSLGRSGPRSPTATSPPTAPASTSPLTSGAPSPWGETHTSSRRRARHRPPLVSGPWPICHGTRVLVFAADLFEDMELLYPVARLQEEGAAVTVAGLDDQPVHGKKGYGPLAVDTTGRPGEGERLRRSREFPVASPPTSCGVSETVLDLVRAFDTAGKPIAFICHAGWVPISAKIVKGRRPPVSAPSVTTWSRGVDWGRRSGRVDGNLISARNPGRIWARGMKGSDRRPRRRPMRRRRARHQHVAPVRGRGEITASS